MLKLVHIPAVALAGLFALSAPAAAREAQDTERVDRTVQIRAGGQLRLKNFSGRVTITGSRRGDVAIHAVRRASRDVVMLIAHVCCHLNLRAFSFVLSNRLTITPRSSRAFAQSARACLRLRSAVRCRS